MSILNYVIGAIIGGVLGFGLYKVVGCKTGACPITSSPYISVGYGALLGLLLVGAK